MVYGDASAGSLPAPRRRRRLALQARKIRAVAPGIDPDPRDYLAVYELEANDAEELAEFVKDMRLALAEGRADISPALDAATASARFAFPITTRVVPLG